MFTKFIVPILILLGIVIGGWYLNSGTTNNEKTGSNLITDEPWIEIKEGSAFVKKGGQGIELKNGETIKTGVSIETGRNGQAVIHTPDGSLLRLDKETSVTLNEISFKEDGLLTVRVGLDFGRVWSKVIEFSNPESVWEVRTPNAVGRALGTAFGVGFKNNRSWFLGSQNKIIVSPIDPISKEEMIDAKVEIGPDFFIEISDKEIKEVTATTSEDVLEKKVVPITKSFSKDIWIQIAKIEDEAFDTIKRPLSNKSGQDLGVNEVKLSIKTDNEVYGIEEGVSIKFQAIAEYSSGKTEDVTETVEWRVLGSVGKIGKSGIFIAKLGDEVSELGEAVGFVVASFPAKKNSSGEEIIAQSELVRVRAAQVGAPLDIGGQ